MKLFYSLTSPYARKCHMVLLVTGLIEETELVLTDQFAEEFRRTNPLGKIPTLRDGDLTLCDSPLICEYLDDKASKNGVASLFSKSTAGYYQRQMLHVQANGILDAAVASVYENRRNDTQPSQFWLTRWQESLEATLKQLSPTSENIHIGTLALMTALGYLDFRLDNLQWRNLNPALADWFAQYETEEWFNKTKPQ